MDENNNKKNKVGTIVALVALGVFLVFIFVKLWGGNEQEVITDNTPTVAPTVAVSEDETYSDYIANMKSDIRYVLTSENYNVNRVKEQETATQLVELREEYGRFSSVIIEISYIDKDLCYKYNKPSMVVFDISATGNNTKLEVQLRCAVAMQNLASGERDVYSYQLEVNTK